MYIISPSQNGDGKGGGGSRLMLGIIALGVTVVTFTVLSHLTQGAENYP